MKISLTEDELKFIKDRVVKPLKKHGADIYVFGSRAKGTCSKFSDLDLLVRSKTVNQDLRKEIAKVSEFLMESNFPYKVDLVVEDDLAQSYRDDILSTLLPV
jgi:uncharacterized protein